MKLAIKFAVAALVLMLGIAGANAHTRYHERSYYGATHKLVSQMNFGNHREYAPLVEQMLNEIPPSANGYVQYMIEHAPRGPGCDCF